MTNSADEEWNAAPFAAGGAFTIKIIYILNAALISCHLKPKCCVSLRVWPSYADAAKATQSQHG